MLTRSLVEGDVKKSLLRFTLPFLAATLLQFFYGAVDLIIVGMFDPTGAGVSAVTTGSQLMQTATSLLMGLASGGTVLIGQYWGAQRREDVSKTIGTMFTFFSILAVVMTAVITLGAGAFVSLMRVPAEAVASARQYVFICGCGVIFITGYNMVSGILRGLGDSKHPMLFVFIACIANIIGDLILVGPLNMGAAGAAIATVAAQALSLLLSVFVLRQKDFPFDFHLRSFRIAGDKLWGLLRLGIPIAIQNILVNISFLIITGVVNGMGLIASAAMGTAGRIIDFCMMGPIAFYSSISAMTAQNIGAGHQERARQTLKYGILFSLIFGVVMFSLIQLSPQGAISIVNKNPEIMAAGALCLRGFSFDCLLVCFVFALNGFFGGCGRTGFTMANSLIATFIVRIPFTLFVASLPDPSLFLIGLASPLASILQILIQLTYYKLGRWRAGSVIKEALPGDNG